MDRFGTMIFMAFNLLQASFSLYQYFYSEAAGLKGGFLCRGTYFVSVVMYRPLCLNMFWILTTCIMYVFTDRLYGNSPYPR